MTDLDYNLLEALGKIDLAKFATSPMQVRISFLSPLIDYDNRNRVFSLAEPIQFLDQNVVIWHHD